MRQQVILFALRCAFAVNQSNITRKVKMHNTPIRSNPWQVGLAILPGLWIAIWQSDVLGQVYGLVGSIVLAAIGSGIIGFSLVTERRLATWSLPSVGALVWLRWKGGL